MQMTFIEKVRACSLMVLIVLIIGLLLDSAGFFTSVEFDNSKTGWSIIKTEKVHFTEVSFSVLKDPEVKDFRIMEGTIKKSALDRMKHIFDDVVRIKGQKSDQQIREDLKFIAKYKGGNTVLINWLNKKTRIESKSYGLAL